MPPPPAPAELVAYPAPPAEKAMGTGTMLRGRADEPRCEVVFQGMRVLDMRSARGVPA